MTECRNAINARQRDVSGKFVRPSPAFRRAEALRKIDRLKRNGARL